jgi:TRAP-type C4-dicarboxylate transport system permease small subunit
VAVTGALARIFLGSLLFGVCGGLAWYSWTNIQPEWMRFSTVLFLTSMFLVSFTALMIGIKIAVDEMMTRVRRSKT